MCFRLICTSHQLIIIIDCYLRLFYQNYPILKNNHHFEKVIPYKGVFIYYINNLEGVRMVIFYREYTPPRVAEC